MNPVGRRFARAAGTYDRGADLHRHVAATLAGLMPDPGEVGSGRILEVGCGTGVLSDRIRQRYPQAALSLLDVAAPMVESVRERWGGGRHVEYVVADMQDYRSSIPFDWIFSSSALHWAVSLERMFSGLGGSLVPGGGLCAALMVDGTLGELHAVRRRVSPFKVPEGRLPTEESVNAALHAAGFTVVSGCQEAIRTCYRSAQDLLATIHAQGLTGGRVSNACKPLSRGELLAIQRLYDETYREGEQGVYATFKVLYVVARSGNQE